MTAAEEFDFDLDDADTSDGQTGNDSAGNSLRKKFETQLRKLTTELKDERKAREVAETQLRTHSVGELFKAAGVKPALAKFYSGDATEDGVTTWVEENAELFGITRDESAADSNQVDEDDRKKMQAVSRAAAQALPTGSGLDAAVASIEKIDGKGGRDQAYAALNASLGSLLGG